LSVVGEGATQTEIPLEKIIEAVEAQISSDGAPVKVIGGMDDMDMDGDDDDMDMDDDDDMDDGGMDDGGDGMMMMMMMYMYFWTGTDVTWLFKSAESQNGLGYTLGLIITMLLGVLVEGIISFRNFYLV
jgi:hypothetical protein